MSKRIAIIAALDTKGADIAFLKERGQGSRRLLLYRLGSTDNTS
jgi:hypothetical protein